VLGIKASPVFSGDGTNNIVEFKKSNGVTRTWVNNNGSDLYVGGNTTESGSVQIGYGATGNQYAYIDLIGDTTFTDYGTRLIRFNGGPNTETLLEHRGSGALLFNTPEGLIRMQTAATTRLEIAANGNVRLPAQPAIVLDGNNFSWVTNTANTTVKALSPKADARGGFSWNSTNGRITVPATGWYAMTYVTYQQGGSTLRLHLRKNEASFAMRHVYEQGDGQTGVYGLVYANANDYFDVFLEYSVACFYGGNHSFATVSFLG
jgi:hypothetical protein